MTIEPTGSDVPDDPATLNDCEPVEHGMLRRCTGCIRLRGADRTAYGDEPERSCGHAFPSPAPEDEQERREAA